MRWLARFSRLFRRPVLTRQRVWLAFVVAVVADGLQLLLGPLGWLVLDEVLELLATRFSPLASAHIHARNPSRSRYAADLDRMCGGGRSLAQTPAGHCGRASSSASTLLIAEAYQMHTIPRDSWPLPLTGHEFSAGECQRLCAPPPRPRPVPTASRGASRLALALDTHRRIR